MNKDQIEGTAKNIAGKVQQKVGEVTGNKSRQAKGIGKQIEGKTQEIIGNAKESIKDVEKKR
jgi:uncharacterized protein YjbJ (UPF0337 family)